MICFPVTGSDFRSDTFNSGMRNRYGSELKQVIFAFLFSLSLVYGTGCTKKTDHLESQSNSTISQAKTSKSTRDKALSKLRTERTEEAAWDLAVLADSDDQAIPAMIEALKDKSNAGLGRRIPERFSSLREGLVQALVWCESPGLEALKSQGFSILREGLKDSSPAVREHTILAIAVMKEHAQPLADDIFQLCTDPEEKVRAAAFGALEKIGTTKPGEMARLLTHGEPDVRRLAAEAINNLDAVPEQSIEPLMSALQHDEAPIRTAAVRALSRIGPKASPAVPTVVAAIRKYSDDPQALAEDDYLVPYWALLHRIGDQSVPALRELLTDRNRLIRALAALTLGQIGPPAKAAVESLLVALKDNDAFLVFSAAVALCRIGEAETEALAAVKRGLNSEDDLVLSMAIDTVFLMGKAGESLIPLALSKADSPMPFSRRNALELAIRLGPGGASAINALAKAAKDEEYPYLRERYLQALATHGPAAKEALPVLLEIATNAMESTGVRRAAMSASAAIAGDSTEVADVLQRVFSESNADLQAAAAEAMGRLQPLPPSIAKSLAAAALKNRHLPVRQAAVKALAFANPPPTNVQEEFSRLKSAKDDLGFWSRVALTRSENQQGELEKLIRENLKENLPATIRAAALSALPLLGAPKRKNLSLVTPFLRDGSPIVRTAAAREIGRYGPEASSAVGQLSILLNDRDREVRLAAIRTLGEIGPAAAQTLSRLKKLSQSDEQSVALAAQLAISKIQPEAELIPTR